MIPGSAMLDLRCSEIARAILDPCFAVDRELRIVLWNPAMEDLTGAPHSAVAGAGIFDVIPAARDTPVHAACARVLEHGEPEHVSYTSTELVPGRRFDFRMYPWSEGVLILAHDLTERHALETRLRERERELEAALERQEMLLREFQHRMSNCMQAIVSLTRLHDGRIDPAFLRSLGRRVEALARVQKHLLTHLDLRSTSEAEEFLRDLIAETLVLFGLDETGEPRVTLRDFPLDSASASRTGMILSELIANVAKHAVPAGATRCDVEIDGDAGHLTLRVRDDGPGFGAVLGQGIGLVVVRDLVTELGGTFDVEGETPRGTAVVITVPRSDPPLLAETAEPAPGCSVLIAEDEWLIATHMRDTLRSHGFRVAGIASRAADVLDAIEREHPDVLLLDISLEEPSSGLTLAEEHALHERTEVVFVTAHTDPDTRARAARCGPHRFVAKPFTERDLVESVRSAARERAHSRTSSRSSSSA